ncbi:MAG: hypothetical protein K0Q90_2952, partial [Paenibacillaceae bacterium]|nr:hypothetical protein [Paenibacillaceae bacterium]
MKARQGTAIAKKIIRRPRSAGLPKSRLMEMYREQV